MTDPFTAGELVAAYDGREADGLAIAREAAAQFQAILRSRLIRDAHALGLNVEAIALELDGGAPVAAPAKPARLPEGTWYKPKGRFELDGERWTTNGHISIVGEAEAEEKDLGGEVRRMLAGCTEKAKLSRGDWVTTQTGGVFAPHLVDLIEQIYGTETRWMIAPSGELEPMAAYVGERPVALLMPRRGMDGHCQCPWCHGKGLAEVCSECAGDGRVEHECTCGSLHEHDCFECAGEGGTGTCPKCDGSKVYRRPPQTIKEASS